MQISGILSGDIVSYNDGTGSSSHIAIALSNVFLVHADGTFLKKEEIKKTASFTKGMPSVFRCNNQELANEAANYAQAFGRANAADPGATKHSQDRARGVTQQSITGIDPPFEYDALYRACKWALRIGKGEGQFSQNKGATCAAFAIACYQAAAMRQLAEGDENRIKRAFDYLAKHRIDKDATRAERWKKKTVLSKTKGEIIVTDAYKREVSNVGAQSGSFDEHLAQVSLILADGVKRASPKLEECLTSPMLIDAKFCFSPVLHKRLVGDAENWVRRQLADLAPIK